MGQEWYLLGKKGEFGPIDSAQLRDFAKRGRISPTTKIRRGSDETYRRAKTIRGLFPDAPSTPPATQSEASEQTPPSIKTKQLFYVVNRKGEERGPFDIARLKQFAEAGRIHPGTRLRKSDLERTNSARRIRGLFSDEAIAAYEAESAGLPEQPKQVQEQAQEEAQSGSLQAVAEVVAPEFTPEITMPGSETRQEQQQPIAQTESAEHAPKKGWLIIDHQDELGPLTTRALKTMAQAGEISPETIVQRISDGRKVPTRKIRGLWTDELLAASEHPSNTSTVEPQHATDVAQSLEHLNAKPEPSLDQSSTAVRHQESLAHQSQAKEAPEADPIAAQTERPKSSTSRLSARRLISSDSTLDLPALERRWATWEQSPVEQSSALQALVHADHLPGSPHWVVSDPGAGLGEFPPSRRPALQRQNQLIDVSVKNEKE